MTLSFFSLPEYLMWIPDLSILSENTPLCISTDKDLEIYNTINTFEN